MKILLVLSLMLFLCACDNTGEEGQSYPAGVPSQVATPIVGSTPIATPSPTATPIATATPVATATPSEVQEIVEAYNATRVALGQDPVTPGLTCYLYTVPTTTTAIVGATLSTVGQWLYTGVFNQPNVSISDSLNVFPPALQNITSWYVMKCTGLLVNVDNAFHEFSVTSDDGANLYVGGLLINNDGLHPSATKVAGKFMSTQVYSFELDYLQGGGSEELSLTEDGQMNYNNYFYH